MRKLLEIEKRKFLGLYFQFESLLNTKDQLEQNVRDLENVMSSKEHSIFSRYLMWLAIIFAGQSLVELGILEMFIVFSGIFINLMIYRHKIREVYDEVEVSRQLVYENDKELRELYKTLVMSHQYIYEITEEIEKNQLQSIDHKDIFKEELFLEARGKELGEDIIIKRLNNRRQV